MKRDWQKGKYRTKQKAYYTSMQETNKEKATIPDS